MSAGRHPARVVGAAAHERAQPRRRQRWSGEGGGGGRQGTFHPYYVSALAPAVAALAGAGLVALWRLARDSWAWLAALQLTIAGTAWLAVTLLARTPDFAPALRVVIPVAAAVAVLGLRARPATSSRPPAR